jgi:hypothetical protein
LEEFDFLLVLPFLTSPPPTHHLDQLALRPLVLSETEIPGISCREDLEKQIAQRREELGIISRGAQLWQEARLFVEAVRNKSSGRYSRGSHERG